MPKPVSAGSDSAGQNRRGAGQRMEDGVHFWKGFVSGICALTAALCIFRFVTMLVPENVLGHYRYYAADPSSLAPVDLDGEILLQSAAADEFVRMQEAARKDGVFLIPLSGFRDYAKQHDLFFHGASLKNQRKTDRSRVCAPPGYSEHHTGYSIDIGDGAFNENSLDLTFKDTASYKWLRRHAGRFHYELSFPSDRKDSRIAYEPWHWRYVGDLNSLKTFFHVRVMPGWMTLAK
jgi:D-alanyl-D-alanine carboxypeptidase